VLPVIHDRAVPLSYWNPILLAYFELHHVDNRYIVPGDKVGKVKDLGDAQKGLAFVLEVEIIGKERREDGYAIGAKGYSDDYSSVQL
jgi:hypothetical protein